MFLSRYSKRINMLVNTMLFLSKNKTFPRNLIAKSFIRKISEESKSSIMSSNNIKKRVALINAKVNYGQGKSGTELGPQLLKNNFLFTNFENLNYPAIEFKEIEETPHRRDSILIDPPSISYRRDSVLNDPSGTSYRRDSVLNDLSSLDIESAPKYNTNAKNFFSLSQTNEKICRAVIEAIEQDYIPVVLGGDHSLAIGSVTGTAAALSNSSQIGLIWIDAHADINTPLTSASGNLHGQPVSFLLYELDKYLPTLQAFKWQKPCVSARNLVYIGLRDLDPEETILLSKYKIKAFSMSDIQKFGINQVVKDTLEHLTIGGELLPLHVSVDIDSLDPWFAPCTGTPVLGGLTLNELMLIGNTIHETGKLKTLDLVEVNPLLKDSERDVEKTVFSACRTILSFFGYKTLGTVDTKFKLPQPFEYINKNKDDADTDIN